MSASVSDYSKEASVINLVGFLGCCSFLFNFIAAFALMLNTVAELGMFWTVSAAMLALLLAVFFYKLCPDLLSDEHRSIIPALLAFLFVAFGAACHLLIADITLPLLFASTVLLFGGLGLHAIPWIGFLSTHDHQGLAFVSGGGLIVTGVGFIVLTYLPDSYLVAIIELLNIISIALSFLIYKAGLPTDTHFSVAQSKENCPRSDIRNNGPALVLAGGTWGICLALAALPSGNSSCALLLSLAFIASGAITLLIRFRREYALETFLLKYGLILTCAGLTVIPFVAVSHPFLYGCAFFYFAVLCSLNLFIILSAILETAVFNNVDPLWFIGRQGGLSMVGSFLFATILIVPAALPFSFELITAVCMLSILLFVTLATTWPISSYPVFVPDEEKPAEEISLEAPVASAALPEPPVYVSAVSGKSAWRDILDAVAAEYSLTARQREVMELLVKGRDCRYIEETFVVSHATAKSHIGNLYRKLGIHSKQELITFMEQQRIIAYMNEASAENEIRNQESSAKS